MPAAPARALFFPRAMRIPILPTARRPRPVRASRAPRRSGRSCRWLNRTRSPPAQYRQESLMCRPSTLVENTITRRYRFHLLGGDLNVFNAARRRRNRSAVFTQPLEVNRDGIANGLLSTGKNLSGRNAPWKVRHVRGVIPARIFDDNRVAHQTCPISLVLTA